MWSTQTNGSEHRTDKKKSKQIILRGMEIPSLGKNKGSKECMAKVHDNINRSKMAGVFG